MRQVPVAERQFSLLLALAATSIGLTKQELFQVVPGYEGRRVDAALERQFDRDKNALREIGIELDAFQPSADADDNKATRYRIRQGAFGTPEELAFDAAERSLIALALRLWQEGGLDEESRLAATKLRASGDAYDPIGAIEPRQRAVDAAFTQLKIACDRGRLAVFDYLKPGERVPATRRLEAWALVLFRGRWRVTGFDRTVGDRRTFVLGRIVSPVTLQALPDPHPVPDDAASAALATLERIWASATARVRALPGSDAEVRLLHRPDTERDGDVLTLHHADTNLLADELAGYGADVVVLEPEALRQGVIERLQRVIAAHTGGDGA